MRHEASVGSPYLAYAEKLPSLPAVALEVVRLSKLDWVDLSELADVIGHDPALAAKILKLANSPLYGRRRRVSTLNEAVATLGLNALKMAALSFSVAGATGTQEELGGYDLRDFWRRALVQSIAGRSFGAAFARKFADESFLLGLLMDISVPIFCRLAGEKYLPVVVAMDGGHPDPLLELENLGVTHALLSGRLMEDWGLPEAMSVATNLHHDPDGAPEGTSADAVEMARIMHLAHWSGSLMTGAQKGEALRQIQDLSARWFGQDATAVGDVLEALSPSVDQLAEIVNVDIGGELKAKEVIDLARGELVEISIAAASNLNRAQTRMNELETRASTDSLTGLNNRATFDATLAREWERRSGEELADALGLVMIDVDHFKQFNDEHGHQAGDEVLRGVARAMKSAVRDTDIVCRYGGEEFAVIAPYASGSQLRALAERTRRAVERMEVAYEGKVLKVTASLGAAALTTDPGDRKPADLIHRADEALYEVKRLGRNRVALAEDF